MIYTVYNPTTGQILHTIQGDNSDWISSNLTDKSSIEGSYSPSEYYIENGEPVAIPANPSAGVDKYTFDYATKAWVYDSDASLAAVRKFRDADLANVDKVSATWFSTLTTEQQTELQQYRQDLLDVTDQVISSSAITWPTKPSWL